MGLICGTALIFALWTYSPLLMTREALRLLPVKSRSASGVSCTLRKSCGSCALLAAVLGTTPETATLAVMYLRVRCFACPAFLLYNVGTGNFRGRKDTRTPLLAYLANNITYVLLVSSFQGVPDCGWESCTPAPVCNQSLLLLKSTAASSQNFMFARRSCYLFLASIGA